MLADFTDDLVFFPDLDHSDPDIYFVDDEDGLAIDFQMGSPLAPIIAEFN